MEQQLPPADEPLQAEFIEPVINRKNPRKFSPRVILMIVIGLSISAVIMFGLFLASRTTDPVEEVATLNTQLASLVTMVKEARKSARHPDVAKASIDASTLIIGDAGTLTLTTKGIKTPKTVTAAEKASFDPVLTEIRSAGIDGRFDRVFVPLFIEKLESVQRQAATVYRRTAQPALRAAVTTTHEHLTSIITTFKAIDTTITSS